MDAHQACDLCSSVEDVVVGRRDRHFRPLTNVLCLNCGLIRQDPLPSEEELRDYYARRYRLHYKGVTKPSTFDVHRDEHRARVRMDVIALVLPENARLLDVGSGNGTFLRLARERGCRVQGIEPNIGYAEWAKRQFGIDAVHGGWADATFPPAAFDFITAHHVLEHLRSPTAALKQFHHWLAPGGHLYISVPNLADRKASPLNRFHSAHLHGFSRRTLIMMALKAGFERVKLPKTAGTTHVFRRLDTPPDDWMIFPQHGRELHAFLLKHNMLRYVLGPDPYRGWIRRLAERIRLHAAAS